MAEIRAWCRRHGPFLVSVAVYLALLGGVVQALAAGNDGTATYVLDDAYIHLALAKNLALHGTYGVNPGEFAPASSAPLWTLWLAFWMLLVGAHAQLAGFWSVVAGVGCLYLVDALGLRYGLAAAPRVVSGLLVLLATPLVAVTLTGMEHTAQLFFVLWLFLQVDKQLAAPGRAHLAGACLAMACAVGTRYECLFVAAPVVVLLVLQPGQRRAAGWLALAAAAPVVVYGIFARLQGGWWLPNSLLLKGQAQGLFSVMVGEWIAFWVRPELVLLLLLSLALVALRTERLWLLCLAALAALKAHSVLAATSSYFRYEAYLVGLIVLLVCVCWLQRAWVFVQTARGWRDGLVLLCSVYAAVLLAMPLVYRAADGIRTVPEAGHNIYQQQFQLARVVREFFPPDICVAVNDLGVMAFYTDAEIVDLYGLASMDVARSKRSGTYGTQQIAAVLNRRAVDLVLVYPNWFAGAEALPAGLQRVGTLSIEGPVLVCGGGAVGLYATSDAMAQRLRAVLPEAFRRLPAKTTGQVLEPGGEVLQTFRGGA